MLDNAGRFWCK